MGLISEFKKFAMRGNVVDMAVGVVIGGAFGLIVTEIVGKVITPIIGYLQQGVDFKDAAWKLPVPVIEGMKAPMIGYGAVLQALLNFIIVAFVLILVIKAMNRMVKKEEAAPAPPSEEILLLREIRDALAKRS